LKNEGEQRDQAGYAKSFVKISMRCKRWFDYSSAEAVADHDPLTLYQLVHAFLFGLKLDLELLSVSHDVDQTLVAPC
jgi:hypothetical protein